MEFCFDTVYDKKSLAVMAKALRKTLRKRHSRRSHVLGWVVIGLSVLLVVHDYPDLTFRSRLTALVGLVLFLTLLFEDKINGINAHKRMLPGTERAKSVFSEESYTSATAVGESVFYYENVAALAESRRYFIFVLSLNYAQLYDKRSITGGSEAEFRAFIEQRCEKTFTRI